jgi:long-subunit acyl-CoA synthetase (AMP-forming)
MLSHDNLTWENKPLMEELKLFAPNTPPIEHRFVSYLPLSHIAGMSCDILI